MSPGFFDQLLIGGRPAHEFAASVFCTSEDYYDVIWAAQWMDSVPEKLKLKLCRQLSTKFLVLIMSNNDLVWWADSRTCIINQDGSVFHLCRGPDCLECRDPQSSNVIAEGVSDQPHDCRGVLQESASLTDNLPHN